MGADGQVAEPASVRLVREYLAMMEARDLAGASRCLAAEAEFVFPGDRRFRSVAQLVAAAETRYRWVAKSFASWDHVQKRMGEDVVVVSGTLHGENRHGVPFGGVRFLDRFVVRDGRIVQQQVWNDLAETGVLAARDSGEVAPAHRSKGAASPG